MNVNKRVRMIKDECVVGAALGLAWRGDSRGFLVRGRSGLPDSLVKKVAALGLLAALAACGGGGGGGSAPAATPVQVLGVSSPRASQGLAGEAWLSFRAALDGATVAYPLEIGFATSSTTAVVGSSCSVGVDYYIPAVAGLSVTVNGASNTSNGKLTIASSAASRQINVMGCPGNSATDKLIQFGWAGGGGSGFATGTILGAANPDLTGSDRLNDTGITSCADGVANGLGCPQEGFPGQDADSGRNTNISITGTGSTRTSAFSFTTLPAANGIQDNVTGLLWEGKTTDGGLHDANSTFTWLNNAAANNGGAAGTAAGGTCTGGVPGGCDTEKFVAAVNAEKLYGFSDWRLPTVQELSTLVNSGASVAPTVDSVIINQFAGEYWSASPKAGDNTGAWVVDFNSGALAAIAKSSTKRVRLVRGR